MKLFKFRVVACSITIYKKIVSLQRGTTFLLFTYVQRIIYPETLAYVAGEGPLALWAPNSGLNDIARVAESCFRKHTRIGKPISLHVDKVVENVQAPPLAKCLWNDIIEQSS